MRSIFQNEKGQSLLVLLMILSVVLSVVVAASYKLVSETQTTQTQEESIRALAAADAGIEKGLELAEIHDNYHVSFADTEGLNNLAGIDSTRSYITISKILDDNKFVSPVVEKDSHYTFYLTDFPTYNRHYTGNLTLYFGDVGDACGSVTNRTLAAVEATIVYGGTNYDIQRFLIEPCSSSFRVEGTTGTAQSHSPAHEIEISDVTYRFIRSYEFNITSAAFPDTIAIILRPLFMDTRFGFESDISGSDFESQGTTIKSEAQTTSGVSKVINVFKSLPQIPAEVMITTF